MRYYCVIDGQSGAGKTPLIAEMQKQLEHRGYSVNIAAPFAAANAMVTSIPSLLSKYPLGIYNAWLESPESAMWTEAWLERYINEQLAQDVDIVLFDRGWLTVCMGISESSLPYDVIQQKFNYWMNKKAPTFFLDTSPLMTQSRQSWNPICPWTNENIHTDFTKRRATIEQYPYLLDRVFVDKARIDLAELSQKWINLMELPR